MNLSSASENAELYDDADFDALPFSLFHVDSQYQLTPCNAKALYLREIHTLFSRRQLEPHTTFGQWLISLIKQAKLAGAPLSENTIVSSNNFSSPQSITVWVCPYKASILLCVDCKEHKISHSASSASAALMTAMLAHEIRNPLLAISGAAQLLKNAGANEALCQLIQSESARIEQLLKDLDPLRAENSLQFTSVNIHQILETAQTVIAAGIGTHVRFEKRFDPSLPTISGDSAALERAFINLLKNAAEACATVAQPTITLTTHFTSLHQAQTLVVEIHDNGVGMPASVAAQLFHPFVTTKKDGRGLGLPIVARIIEEHAGHIELVHSRKNATLFRVFLPTHRLQNATDPV